jgi:putative transcriptional regulator
MVSFHPDSRLMNEYSAGSLPLAQSACVSIHLNYCEQCQRQSRRLQQMGSALFERLTPQQVDDSLLDSVLARLGEEPPLTYGSEGVAAGASDDGYPALVQRLMTGNYDDLEWKRVSSALQVSHLRTGDVDHEFALYHIKAGGSIPKHTHRGTELTLVLEGSFSDEEGVYQQGDFLMRDSEDVHSPTAARTADCVCIGVLDAPIRFTGWNYRLLNPFLKLQIH